MVYAWGIDIDEKRIACGVVVAKTSERAEELVRSDWKIKGGSFSYSTISPGKNERSVLLYKCL